MSECNLPKISIITPSFNQARFIEETILSVLNQNYPGLEFIIVDGGSTDGTLDILRKFEDRLIWTSHKDKGQSNAINIGFQRSTGDVLAYLNSDDILVPGSLKMVGQYIADHEDCYCLTGRCRTIDEQGKEIRKLITLYKNFWMLLSSPQILLVLNFISQPATFWRRSVIDTVGGLNESLYYTMDYDYWLRISRHFRIDFLQKVLACFRVHSHSKSGMTACRQFDEELLVARRYGKDPLIALHAIHRSLIVFVYKYFLKLERSPEAGLAQKNESTT